MSSDTSFAGLVKARRIALGMSQASLAELVGRSASAVRSWERGSSTPTDENVVRSLAAVLGIEEETLRGSVGMPPDSPPVAVDVGGGDALAEFASEITDDRGIDPVADMAEMSVEDDDDFSPEADPAGAAVDPVEVTGETEPSEEVVESEPAPPVDSLPEEAGPEPATPEDESAEPDGEVEVAPTAEELAAADEGATEGPASPLDEEPGESAPEAIVAPAPSPVGERDPIVESAMPAAASITTPTATIPVATRPSQLVEPSYLDDPDQMMTYWIRAALTVALSVFLLIVLFWALGRLGDSIGEVWDIFKSGA